MAPVLMFPAPAPASTQPWPLWDEQASRRLASPVCTLLENKVFTYCIRILQLAFSILENIQYSLTQGAHRGQVSGIAVVTSDAHIP